MTVLLSFCFGLGVQNYKPQNPCLGDHYFGGFYMMAQHQQFLLELVVSQDMVLATGKNTSFLTSPGSEESLLTLKQCPNAQFKHFCSHPH